MNHPVRTAIIGTGGIANAHAAAIQQNAGRIELVAVMDIDADRANAFGDKYGVPLRFTNVDDLLTVAHPDLVQICTPPKEHTALAIKALEGGAHVWCEKPLCASLTEFDRISEAEARTGRTVSTVFQWRSGAMGKHVYGLLERGELGRPLVGVCNTLWYRDAAYYAVDWRGKWSNELGGVTLGHGIHLIDLYLWLMSAAGAEWESVHAQIATLDHTIEIEDVSLATVRFSSGALGSVVSSVVSPRQETYLRMDFQRGTVEVTGLYHYQNANWRFTTYEKSPIPSETVSAWGSPDSDVPSGHAAALGDVIDSLALGKRPLVSAGESRRILEFITSLYKSAFTGETIRRGSITPDDPFYGALNGETK